MKEDWKKYTIIKGEMFDTLLKNTTNICSNDILWTKVNQNTSEIIRKFKKISLNISEIIQSICLKLSY